MVNQPVFGCSRLMVYLVTPVPGRTESELTGTLAGIQKASVFR